MDKRKMMLGDISCSSILRMNLVIPTLVEWVDEGYRLKLMLNENEGIIIDQKGTNSFMMQKGKFIIALILCKRLRAKESLLIVWLYLQILIKSKQFDYRKCPF
jgi:hypothetical protein